MAWVVQALGETPLRSVARPAWNASLMGFLGGGRDESLFE